MKKKFKHTKLGKFILKPAVKGLIGSVPIVGDIVTPILTEVKGHGEGEIISEAGQVDKSIIPQLIKVGILVVLLYLVMSGKISWDDAETAKDFLE